MAPTREKLLQTAHALIESYSKWSLDSIIEHRSADCLQHTLPSTRNAPTRNNDEYREFFAARLPVYRNFKPTVCADESFVDVEQRKVYMHVRSKADTAVGEYTNEYAFVVRMTEDGEKVEEIWEFVDSAHTVAFAAKLLEAGIAL